MVTIIGLIFLTLGVVIIIPFDKTVSSPLPSWVYIAFAVLVFIGQTLDAIDGKHARNTNRSSPLGQLMDHGCDAFSNSFVIVMICQAHLLGHTIYTLVVQVLVQLPFYIITWEEHYTGTLITHIDNMGVTEFQFIAMGCILLPVFVGPEVTHNKIFGLNFTISEFLVYANGF
jgi:ethanolaminephosphotransferase